jgi:hypothetical protein
MIELLRAPNPAPLPNSNGYDDVVADGDLDRGEGNGYTNRLTFKNADIHLGPMHD